MEFNIIQTYKIVNYCIIFYTYTNILSTKQSEVALVESMDCFLKRLKKVWARAPVEQLSIGARKELQIYFFKNFKNCINNGFLLFECGQIG